MELGIIGLGKMGGNLATQCIDKRIRVVGKARGPKPKLTEKGVKVVENYDAFVSSLKPPRVIYLSLPAGPTIDKVLKELVPHLDKGVVVIDGGNSYYKDSIRREAELSKIGIYFVDCGTSGGVEAALEALNLLRPNSVMCFLGVYREKRACEEFGKVLTTMVLGNSLMFGSVSSNRSHFEMGIKDMLEMQRRYRNVLNKLITKRLYLTDFKQAFKSEREDIKTVIYFK